MRPIGEGAEQRDPYNKIRESQPAAFPSERVQSNTVHEVTVKEKKTNEFHMLYLPSSIRKR